jgi:endonuclease YncB( thermonuclease family)
VFLCSCALTSSLTKTRTEKWGRFLADVFYKEVDSAPEEIIEGGEYLNQVLLDKGYAVRMEE